MSKRKDSDIIPFYHAFAADTNSSKRTKVMQDSIKKAATKWYDDVYRRGMHFDITNVEFDISPVAENINFQNNMIYFSGKNVCDTKEENLCNLPKDKSKYQICTILDEGSKLKVVDTKNGCLYFQGKSMIFMLLPRSVAVNKIGMPRTIFKQLESLEKEKKMEHMTGAT